MLFVHSKMKFFILASVLLLISFCGCTYGNEDNGAKLGDKYFNLQEQLNSPEHMRRKVIMHKERSYVAGIYRNTTEGLVPVCTSIVNYPNEVIILEGDCTNEDPDQMIVVYKCHLRDQNNKATREFRLLGAFALAVTPIEEDRTMRVRTTDPPEECVIFTASEAVQGNYPWANPPPTFITLDENRETANPYLDAHDEF